MVGNLVTRGAVAGFSSGLVFLAADMGWAVHNGKLAVAPLIDISTIFNTQEMPAPITAAPFGPENVVVGLVTHATFSILFGIAFAVAAASLVRRSSAVLPVAGIAYGLLLYVINFQVLGRTAFPWFTNPMGPPQEGRVLVVTGLRPDSEVGPQDLGLPDGHDETANLVTIRDGKVIAMQDYRSRAEAIDALQGASDGC